MFKLGKVVEVALKKKVARPLKNENFGLSFQTHYFDGTFSSSFADFRFKGRFTITHTNPHEGGQALQVCPM